MRSFARLRRRTSQMERVLQRYGARMNNDVVFFSRLVRLPISGLDGVTIGHVDDVVLAPPDRHDAPPLAGFVASVERRLIFIARSRVDTLDASGIGLRTSVTELRHFERRAGEFLGSELMNRRIGDSTVLDLAFRPIPGRSEDWEFTEVLLATSGALRRRRSARLESWRVVLPLLDFGPLASEVASLRELHPSDAAERIRGLPLEHRRRLAEAMEDEHLAELLEQLPESEQLGLIAGLDLERLVHVLEEMDPDDAVDLLAEMTGERRSELLEAMDSDDAVSLRQLLTYEKTTAGGLMTTDPVVVSAETTVAEALARLREPELYPALAAQIFVTEEPTEIPSGTFLGVVGIQRLLREPPSLCVGRCLHDQPSFVAPHAAELEVAKRLATYDLLAIPVCDENKSLLGVVTVDDILDHLLPVNWRQRTR